MKNNRKIKTTHKQLPKSSIIIYKDPKLGPELKVYIEKETVWLNLNQITKLFQRDKSVISRHINNIFKEKELSKDSVVANFATTASDGKIYYVNYYNLDMILSVGYRVKSKIATKFRIWSTKILKKYIIQGYAINQKRLLQSQEKFQELQRVIKFITDKSAQPKLKKRAKELLSIINEYSKSLTLLHEYDQGKIKLSKKQKSDFVLKYVDCQDIINQTRKELAKKKEATDLFGREVSKKFQSIITSLCQKFSNKDSYPSLEQKAAHLLYLTIKDHPFTDGNKRIGSLLFIYYLEKNNYLFKQNFERKISNNALVALALLIAGSDPKEKEIMIKLITNLLK
ncbi:hypothetical protein CL633_02460 [bacterium]|nr:hypothetical protein [bacterium]|tara:strand:- start:1482 stop:2501 length:1020 start_codon:yes stop_codon:yes gene_type:complete